MKKSVAAGLGCVVIALLLVLKTCAGSDAVDSPAATSPTARKERAAAAPTPPLPVERMSSGKYEERWTNPKTGTEQKVRKVLEMSATPAVEMVAGEAVGTVAVEVAENGEVWRPERKAWGKMTDDEFREWRGGARDKHAAVAKLVKALDPQTKRPVVIRREAVGDGAEMPVAKYNQTEDGINITLEWEGDKLRVKWGTAGVDGQKEEVAIPFDPHYLD